MMTIALPATMPVMADDHWQTLHDGSLILERAELGGLAARLWLPKRAW